MSGLTLGLMSLDVVDLEILKRSGSPKEQRYAERIVPVRAALGWVQAGRAGCASTAVLSPA